MGQIKQLTNQPPLRETNPAPTRRIQRSRHRGSLTFPGGHCKWRGLPGTTKFRCNSEPDEVLIAVLARLPAIAVVGEISLLHWRA